MLCNFGGEGSICAMTGTYGKDDGCRIKIGQNRSENLDDRHKKHLPRDVFPFSLGDKGKRKKKKINKTPLQLSYYFLRRSGSYGSGIDFRYICRPSSSCRQPSI